MGLEKWR